MMRRSPRTIRLRRIPRLRGARGICSRLFWLVGGLASTITITGMGNRQGEGERDGGSGRTFGALPAQTLVIHHVLGPLDAVAGGVGVGAAQTQDGAGLRLLRLGLLLLRGFLDLGLGLRALLRLLLLR